jgi:hypothetical protein
MVNTDKLKTSEIQFEGLVVLPGSVGDHHRYLASLNPLPEKYLKPIDRIELKFVIPWSSTLRSPKLMVEREKKGYD